MSDYQSYFENGGFSMSGNSSFGIKNVPLIGDLYGLGLDAAKSAIGLSFDKKRADYNSQLAEEAAKRQYERQLDFWQKQNEYNDPAAVRKRLESAGLGASALMGGAQVQNVGGSSGPLSQVPGNEVDLRGRYAQVENPITRMMQLAQIRNIEADSQLKESQAGETNANINYLGALGRKEDAYVEYLNSSRSLLDNQFLTESVRRSLMENEKWFSDFEKSIKDGVVAEAGGISPYIGAENDRLESVYYNLQTLIKSYEHLSWSNSNVDPLYLEELRSNISMTKAQIFYYSAYAELAKSEKDINEQELWKLCLDILYEYDPEGLLYYVDSDGVRQGPGAFKDNGIRASGSVGLDYSLEKEFRPRMSGKQLWWYDWRQFTGTAKEAADAYRSVRGAGKVPSTTKTVHNYHPTTNITN